MSQAPRWNAAARVCFRHLLVSLGVAGLAAALVFGLWYPAPYDQMLGGRDLFLLLLTVDVVCGPLLTLIVFNPAKPRGELWRDIGVIVALQLAALGYGLHTVTQARPVHLAFEFDMFRVVRAVDFDVSHLEAAPLELRPAPWRGPGLIGVRIVRPGDPDYLRSLEKSLSGLPAAFRPDHWLPYDAVRSTIQARAKAIGTLRAKHPEQATLIDQTLARTGYAENQLGYLPMMAERGGDWVVLLRLDDTTPVGYLPLDGW